MSYALEMSRLEELATDKLVLELGSAVGVSTLHLARTAKQVHSVDWHLGDEHNGVGDTLEQFLWRTRTRPNIVAHVGRFEDVLPLLTPRSFDLVFLDGFHSYAAVCRDIALAEPLVARPGTLVFHDYGVTDFGVTEAVDEHFPGAEIHHSLAIVRLGSGSV